MVRTVIGSSHAPGTRTISICSSVAPRCVSASIAPVSSGSVTKLLKRLTTIAKRSPSALNSLSKVWLVASLICSNRSSACKYCSPFFQKCCRAFATVFRRGGQPKRHRFEAQPGIEPAIEPCVHRFHRQSHSERAIGDHFQGPLFRGCDQLLLRCNRVYESDAMRFLCVDRLAREQQLKSASPSDQPRQTLCRAIARHDSEFYFWLPQLRVGRCDANGAAHRKFQTAAQRITIDRRHRRFAQSFERTENMLPAL